MKFQYENAQISKEEIQSLFRALSPYINQLNEVPQNFQYSIPESFINLPFDEEQVKTVVNMKNDMASKKLKYIILIGIGGSDLGTKAIYEAVQGYFDALEPDRYPKILFVETTDANYLKKLRAFLSTVIKKPDEILVNVISKSGTTLETITNLQTLKNSLPKINTRIVVTTEKGSPLWKQFPNHKLSIPKGVGGRFSVFSPVGLFPLICSGIDIVELLEGAMEQKQKNVQANIQRNLAAASAICIFSNYKRGKTIHDSFFFDPELESLGNWYEQLQSESLGKQGKGITPTTSIGSADLHSDTQLDLGGPKNKIFTFIHSKKGHSKLEKVEKVLFEAPKKAYQEVGIPLLEIVFDEISPKELGQFMQFKMMEILYLAKLMEIDAFNQPDIEMYKKEVKKILNQ